MGSPVSFLNRLPNTMYGTIVIPLSTTGWKVNAASFLVSENRTRNLLDFAPAIGDSYYPNKEIIEVDLVTEEAILGPIAVYWRNHFTKKYAQFFNRLAWSKSHNVFTNFKVPLIPRQLKGRKIPLHIQNRVAQEIIFHLLSYSTNFSWNEYRQKYGSNECLNQLDQSSR